MRHFVRHQTRNNRRTASHVNRAGGISYDRSIQERVLQVLTTGTLSNTFYATGQELVDQAREVLVQARQQCPHFLARALVYARQQGMMRKLPVFGLAILSGGGGQTRQLFEQAFDQIILTPDDLRAFVSFCLSGKIPGRKGLGGMTVGKVKGWMSQMSEYHAVKYGSANSREVTLRDILRLSHPKPQSEAVAERFAWLSRGRKALGNNPKLNPMIRSLESLKLSPTEDAKVTLIREGGLPFEVVIPSVGEMTTKMWEQLLHQAPYFNLLRNLNAFTRHGVFDNEANVRYAVSRLTDPAAIERSKILPFRYFDAWTAFTAQGGDSRIADALREALELSFANMPTLSNRKIAIGTDTSGSMNCQVSEKGTTRFIDIAGIFTGALIKRIEGQALPILFDTHVHLDHGLSSRDDILVTAKKVGGYCGGGTAVGAPIQYLLDRQIKVDAFIGITDNEDWASGSRYYASENFLKLWRRYRKEVNQNAVAFLVTVAPDPDAVAPAGEKGVHFIYGWSDRVLNYITLTLEEGESQVKAIEQMDLGRERLGETREADDANAQIED